MKAVSDSLILPSLVVVLSGALWGFYWIPIRFLESQGLAGPSAGAFLNLAPAAILVAIAVWTGAKLQDFKESLLAGALIGLAIASFSAGLIYSSVARATLIFYLMPIWSTLIGMFWLAERVGWARYAGIACGLLGLIFLVSGKQSVPLNLGDLLALISGIFWAIGAGLIKRKPNMPTIPIAAIQFIVAAIGSIVLLLLLNEPFPNAKALIGVTPHIIAAAVFVLVPSVLGLTWAQKKLFPGRVGILLMSEVVVSILSAALLLPQERLLGLQWLGCLLIVGAFFLETLGSADATDQETRD